MNPRDRVVTSLPMDRLWTDDLPSIIPFSRVDESMGWYVLLGGGVLLAALTLLLKLRGAFPDGVKAGDFWKVEVPRTLQDGPLAMGTRLDIGALLKKSGVPLDVVRGLIDAGNDAELLRRYWALRDEAESADDESAGS
jgi:hypothetical protein